MCNSARQPFFVTVGEFSALSLAMAWALALAHPSQALGQLTVGNQGGLSSYRPSENVGRFSTDVLRGTRAIGPGQMGSSQFSRSSLGRVSGNGLRAGPYRGSYGGGRGALSSDLSVSSGFTAASGSQMQNYGGGSLRFSSSARYLGDVPPPRPSILDILAQGGSLSNLPAGPFGEDNVGGEVTEPLPGVSVQQGEQLQEWADATFASRIAAGQAQLRKHDYAAARTSFNIARTIEPDRPEPRIGLIQISLLIGNYNIAAQMIQGLGQRAPNAFATKFDVNAWHESQEQYDEFLRRFRQEIVDTSKAGAMIRVLMGYVAWTTGEREQALNYFRQASVEVPQERAWINIIRMLESPNKSGQPTLTPQKKQSGGWPAF